MKILLDTHALLWWLADSDALGAEARGMVADPTNDIVVSVVSFWEIAIKMRIGKLEANLDDIMDAVALEGFVCLNITSSHLQTLMTLPILHRDPFDHLLIAQARAENAVFLSEDSSVQAYPVQVVRCSSGV